MAIEDTKFVGKIEAKLGGKSGTFWTVTWTDGKTDRIFDPDFRDLCEKAQEGKLAVHYTKKKEGNFWNIKTLELVCDALPDARLPQPTEDIGLPSVFGGEPRAYAPQELGMWWKELGNRIGDGSLEKDYPKAHIKIKGQYYKKMSEVTGVSFS